VEIWSGGFHARRGGGVRPQEIVEVVMSMLVSRTAAHAVSRGPVTGRGAKQSFVQESCVPYAQAVALRHGEAFGLLEVTEGTGSGSP
jgi:hypothetical protein